MEITFRIFLVIHIISGTTGLLAGTINILRKKGDKTHKLAGKFFLYSMLAVGFSAFVLSVLHPNYFLFIVGVFTIYMAASGDRYLRLKNISISQRPGIIDWALTSFMAVFGMAFIGFGIYNLVKGNNFGIVLIVFGLVGLKFVKTDIKNFRGKSNVINFWLLAHLQRMIGAYIAALTAFLVVNGDALQDFLPTYVIWLLPTVLVVPFIFKWTNKFKLIKKSNTPEVGALS
ncbi:MAG: hypothetical protein ABI359_09135 [Ginsengibacter sp.]